MKTKQTPETARPITLAAVALAALTLATSAFAQYKPVGDDGITASPKVRQMLNERKASTVRNVPAAQPMSCPKCADVKTTEVNPQAKGGQFLAGTATKTVLKHTCAACQTSFAVTGEGKGRHTVAYHTCYANGENSATCCASN